MTAPGNSEDLLGGLPELQDAVLDWSIVARLFDDLAVDAEVLGILVKGGATHRAESAPPSLGTAHQALLEGAVAGVQIRYVHRGSEWRDTLIRTGSGVRLVRIRK